jgi:hypothetical protein
LLPEFSLIAFQNGFWFEIFKNVLAGAIWAVLAWLIWKLVRVVQHLIKIRRTYYRINGTWIGPCTLPRPGQVEVEGIEIYHLNKRGENVTFSFFHYRPDTPTITRYEGAGVYRGGMFSAFYFLADSNACESGVFVLLKLGELFKGIYAQYLQSSGMKPYQSRESFILRRIRISFWQQVKMLLRRPPFPSYEQAKALYDAARHEQPDPEVQAEVVISP